MPDFNMEELLIDQSRFDFRNPEVYAYKSLPGLNKKIIEEMTLQKEQPKWLLEKRLKALEVFKTIKDPKFGIDVSGLDLNKIIAYIKPKGKRSNTWEEVPDEIKDTFEKLGIPEAERKALAGVGAQYDSEVVYQHVQDDLQKLGVIFMDMESAVKQYPDLVKQYFMKAVPVTDHKYAALHGAIWSGGTFLYVPKGVKVPLPLQAYFRMNNPGMGQLEHTLIIADEGAEVSFIEGCSAPFYNTTNIHAGMVEIYVRRGARVKYVTIQNWSKNTYNKTEIKAITYAGANQHMDAGAKVLMLAPHTSANIDARSISVAGGWSFYRGWLKVSEKARGAKASVECQALMLDNESKSDTVPLIEVYNDDADVGHEAKIGRIL